MAFRGQFFGNRQHPNLPTFNSAGSSVPTTPFQVTNTGDDLVIVEPYSYLLENLRLKDNLPICGLNYAFQLQYGEKIYLETVFDSTGQVAYSHVDREASWLIGKNDSAGKPALVYPDCISVMSKTEAPFLAKFLTDQQKRLGQQAQEDDQYWQQQIDVAGTDQVAKAAAAKIRTDHAKLWQDAQKKLQAISDKQKDFFSNTTTIRRQVACYNLIGYTTKNPDAASHMNSLSITPPKAHQQAGDVEGSDDVMKNPLFYCVQCLNHNLMLEDFDFKRTACRYPVEFSGPVYYFTDPDTHNEEDYEILDDNSDNTGAKH